MDYIENVLKKKHVLYNRTNSCTYENAVARFFQKSVQ